MGYHDFNQLVLDPPSVTKFHFQIIFFSNFVFNLSLAPDNVIAHDQKCKFDSDLSEKRSERALAQGF
jgi:hypothetical protein